MISDYYRKHKRLLLVDNRWPLRADQHAVAAFIADNKRGYILNPPRMGKTAACLAAIQWLKDEGEVSPARPALIVCPLALVDAAWAHEARLITPSLAIQTLTGGKAERQAALKRPADIFITNNQGVVTLGLELCAKAFSMIIFDELTEYMHTGRFLQSGKVRGTVKYAWAKRLADKCPRVIGMTGTPGNPLQAYAQSRLITPAAIAVRESAWKDAVRVASPFNPYRFSWRQGAWDAAKAALSPSIRFSKEEILDLPKTVTIKEKPALSPKALARIAGLKREGRIELEKGAITLQGAAQSLSKYLQIGAGSVHFDGKAGVEHYDIAGGVEALMTHLKASPKLLVYAGFIGVIKRLRDNLRERGIEVGVFTGDSDGQARGRALSQWREGKNPSVLILHPRCGSYGLELAYASRLIWWGAPLCGSVLYAQACERLSSPKQQSASPAVVQFAFTGADARLFSALESGTEAANAMLDSLTSYLRGDDDS